MEDIPSTVGHIVALLAAPGVQQPFRMRMDVAGLEGLGRIGPVDVRGLVPVPGRDRHAIDGTLPDRVRFRQDALPGPERDAARTVRTIEETGVVPLGVLDPQVEARGRVPEHGPTHGQPPRTGYEPARGSGILPHVLPALRHEYPVVLS